MPPAHGGYAIAFFETGTGTINLFLRPNLRDARDAKYCCFVSSHYARTRRRINKLLRRGIPKTLG